MALLSEQVVIGGTVKLWTGTLMPLSTYQSELGRIREQSDRLDPELSEAWRDRKCRRTIINEYGRRCYDCKELIEINYNEEPILRPVSKDEAASNGCASAFFHADCWDLYKVYHANKRRRSTYSGRTRPKPPPPPVPLQPLADGVVADEPPPLPIENQVKDDEA